MGMSRDVSEMPRSMWSLHSSSCTTGCRVTLQEVRLRAAGVEKMQQGPGTTTSSTTCSGRRLTSRPGRPQQAPLSSHSARKSRALLAPSHPDQKCVLLAAQATFLLNTLCTDVQKKMLLCLTVAGNDAMHW